MSLFTRERVRSIALEKVFVKLSFLKFIFIHGYICALFQFKRKVIPNLKLCVKRKGPLSILNFHLIFKKPGQSRVIQASNGQLFYQSKNPFLHTQFIGIVKLVIILK